MSWQSYFEHVMGTIWISTITAHVAPSQLVPSLAVALLSVIGATIKWRRASIKIGNRAIRRALQQHAMSTVIEMLSSAQVNFLGSVLGSVLASKRSESSSCPLDPLEPPQMQMSLLMTVRVKLNILFFEYRHHANIYFMTTHDDSPTTLPQSPSAVVDAELNLIMWNDAIRSITNTDQLLVNYNPSSSTTNTSTSAHTNTKFAALPLVEGTREVAMEILTKLLQQGAGQGAGQGSGQGAGQGAGQGGGGTRPSASADGPLSPASEPATEPASETLLSQQSEPLLLKLRTEHGVVALSMEASLIGTEHEIDRPVAIIG